MLTIYVEEQEFFNETSQMFFYTKPIRVRLEHSLLSISKWEMFWEKPYIKSGTSPGMSGRSEELHYISCMIIGSVPSHIPPLLYQNHLQEIRNYINSKQSATTIYRRGKPRPSRVTVTTELVYYWMIKFGIPFECEKWHFNRLLMLIDVCNIKENEKGKDSKLTPKEAALQRHAINKARRGQR